MKVKVFALSRWTCVIILALDILMWVLFFVGDGVAQFQGRVFFWSVLILFLVIIPVIIFAIDIFAMNNDIVFDSRGVSRVRFGKVIRSFSWEEIKTISTTSEDSFSGWIYISNEVKSFNHLSITRMRLDRKVIYLHMSEKAKEALQRFVPEYLKDKIEKL